MQVHGHDQMGNRGQIAILCQLATACCFIPNHLNTSACGHEIRVVDESLNNIKIFAHHINATSLQFNFIHLMDPTSPSDEGTIIRASTEVLHFFLRKGMECLAFNRIMADNTFHHKRLSLEYHKPSLRTNLLHQHGTCSATTLVLR